MDVLTHANGHLGNDVFLICDSSMDPEEFQKVLIRGLTHLIVKQVLKSQNTVNEADFRDPIFKLK